MNQRLRVLLVDDNPQDRALVARQLRKEFAQLELSEAIDQRQLSERLRSADIDLVITDYALQWSDGLAVLKSVKATNAHCPVIMFTATGSEEIAVEAMKNGLDDYVIKTVHHLQRLTVAVNAVLSHSETARRAQSLENRLADLTRRMKVGVFRAAGDGQLLEVNHAFRVILGLDPGDPIERRNLAEFFLDEGDFRRCWECIQLDDRPDNCEAQMRRTDGRVVWTSSRLIAREQQRGSTVVEALLDDITEQKMAESTLRKNEAELAHVGRLMTMGEMVAGIAHEINQPLGAIANYCAGSLLSLESVDFPGVEQVRDATRRVSEQAQRGAQIIRRLRDFVARRDAERKPADLSGLVRESTAMVNYMLRESQVTVNADAVEPVPELEVDRVQIQQVLINLVRNACDAMEQVSPDDRIVEIAAAHREGLVEISVADRGTGLPEGGVDRLFQPFVSYKPEGMGMGLAISQSIVRHHGGRMWAESNPFGGATFRFTLPIGGEYRSHA